MQCRLEVAAELQQRWRRTNKTANELSTVGSRTFIIIIFFYFFTPDSIDPRGQKL